MQMGKALAWVALAVLAAIIAIFVAAGAPIVRDHFKQLTGPSSWQPASRNWNPVQQTTLRVDPGGVLQLTTPAGYMRWFGAYLPSPRLCNYHLSLDARSVDEPAGALYGYGIAPGATVTAEGVPQGEGVQYDRGFRALRYPDYPYDSADNQSGYIDPEQNFLDGTAITVNGQWHHWLITVSGTTATVSLDNHQARSLQLAGGCTGGIYLRIWNGTADFKNITISKASHW
jgi:hypothetical protein